MIQANAALQYMPSVACFKRKRYGSTLEKAGFFGYFKWFEGLGLKKGIPTALEKEGIFCCFKWFCLKR